MLVLIILSILDLIAMFIVNPVNIITWMSIFTTGSFILRPMGIHVKVEKIIPIEVLIAFLAFNGSLLLKTFSITNYLLMIAIRSIFYLIVYYDDKNYVYVQEEEEKEI